MRVLKSYGTDGGVIVSAPEACDDVNKKEPVFIEFDGLPVPFFIEEFTPRGGVKYYLKLVDIDNLEMAEELVGKEITLEEEEEDGDDLIGYILFDQNGRKVGEVSAFEDIPGNPCIEVQGTLIPCPDECIIKIDTRKRTLKLQIADGLI